MRREFSAKIKVAAFERAGGKCEICGIVIRYGAEFDHRVPDGIGGEPSVENCQVLCKTCHALKTSKSDVPTIAKSKRVRERHIGAEKPRGWYRPPGYKHNWGKRAQ